MSLRYRSPVPDPAVPPANRSLAPRVGLGLGPALFAAMLLLPPPAGLPEDARRVAAVAALMAVWWITEAIPIAATALLPLALFPLLGVLGIGETAAPYANPVIFLFLGGFLIAAALEHCGLHRRLALSIVRRVGTRPSRLVAGFMAATALLSMWVSNTATVVMMLPTALSIVALAEARSEGNGDAGDPRFATALMLGVAYAANIGGLGTLIGTPPNALLAGYLAEAYGIVLGFGEWMLLGVPLVLVALPLCWLLLTRVLHPLRGGELPGGREAVSREIADLGRLGRAEVTVGAITAATALAWVLRPVLERWLAGLSDAGIAVAGALLLFLAPVGGGERALTWARAESRLPWSVLVLFGGGLSLAAAIQGTGLAEWIGGALGGLGSWPAVAVVLAVTVIVIFLTELTSNTATAAAFLPVAGALAVGLGGSPQLLAVPTALAASCAFMLPVATPPNAIVYGSGRVSIAQMARAGLGMNLLMTLLIVLAVWLLL